MGINLLNYFTKEKRKKKKEKRKKKKEKRKKKIVYLFNCFYATFAKLKLTNCNINTN